MLRERRWRLSWLCNQTRICKLPGVYDRNELHEIVIIVDWNLTLTLLGIRHVCHGLFSKKIFKSWCNKKACPTGGFMHIYFCGKGLRSGWVYFKNRICDIAESECCIILWFFSKPLWRCSWVFNIMKDWKENGEGGGEQAPKGMAPIWNQCEQASVFMGHPSLSAVT